MSIDFAPIWAHRDQVIEGVLTTAALSAAGLAGSLLIGVPVGAAGASSVRRLRIAAIAYVEAARNIPVLLHIYLWYFAFASLDLPAAVCAVLGLSVYSGAYAAEIVHAGLLAVPPGQADAARALGLTRWRTWHLVSAPQAFRLVAPSLASLFSQMIKDSSLGSVIAVGELTYQAGAIEADTFRSVEVYAVVVISYVAIVSVVGHAVRRMPGRAASPQEA